MTRIILGARTAAIVLATVLNLAACQTGLSFPPTAPDARGTLTPYTDDKSASPYPPSTRYFRLSIDNDAYSYYSDAALRIDSTTVIGDQSGDVVDVSDLAVGQVVDVWTSACAESYPVQCGVTHMRVTTADRST
jgi:hypothetical protein